MNVRPLARTDLDAVVAADAALLGRTRRAYFERRLAAALRQPELHLQFAAWESGVLRGYALARVLEGEFGRSRPALRLEVISAVPGAQGRGVGRALHGALEAAAARRGIAELRTSAGWRDHGMLRFLDAMGWALAPAQVLECDLHASPLGSGEAPASMPERAGDPNDWSAASANDYEELARDRAEVGVLAAGDLEALVRIDRGIVGRERRDYMRHALDEALRDGGVRVSLAARRDGHVVGYAMARADLGDFGRTEPAAVLDTIGVDRGYAHLGIGRALLSQLFLNLAALGIERVETAVASGALDLLGFFGASGFAPGQRLAFVKQGRA